MKPAQMASKHFAGQPSSTFWMKWRKGNCDCAILCYLDNGDIMMKSSPFSEVFFFFTQIEIYGDIWSN